MSAPRTWFRVVLTVCENREISILAANEDFAIELGEYLFHDDHERFDRTSRTIIHSYARTNEFDG